MMNAGIRGVLLAMLLMSGQALAFGTYRAGNVVLDQGDSAMKVVDAMGQPVWRSAVVNKFGAQVAENWYYREGRKTVRFTISGGQVTAIEEMRD